MVSYEYSIVDGQLVYSISDYAQVYAAIPADQPLAFYIVSLFFEAHKFIQRSNQTPARYDRATMRSRAPTAAEREEHWQAMTPERRMFLQHAMPSLYAALSTPTTLRERLSLMLDVVAGCVRVDDCFRVGVADVYVMRAQLNALPLPDTGSLPPVLTGRGGFGTAPPPSLI